MAPCMYMCCSMSLLLRQALPGDGPRQHMPFQLAHLRLPAQPQQAHSDTLLWVFLSQRLPAAQLQGQAPNKLEIGYLRSAQLIGRDSTTYGTSTKLQTCVPGYQSPATCQMRMLHRTERAMAACST